MISLGLDWIGLDWCQEVKQAHVFKIAKTEELLQGAQRASVAVTS